MFKVFQRRSTGAPMIELLADGLICFLAVLSANATLSASEHGFFSLAHATASPDLILSGLVFAVTMALLYSFVGLYRHSKLSMVSVVLRVALVFLVGGYITYLTTKHLRSAEYPSQLVGYALLYLLAGLTLYRGTAWCWRRMFGVHRVLIVGTGDEAQQVWNSIRVADQWAGYEVVGFYPTSDASTAGVRGADAPVLSATQRLSDLVRSQRVNEIIVAVKEQRGGGVPIDQLLDCRIAGVPIMDLAGFFERTRAEVPVESLKASWLVYGNGFIQGRARELTKRAFDVLSSLSLLIIGSPIMVLTALAIKLDSPGPILYRQERVGLGGASFMCIKFRSMRTDAEKDGVARWASKNDSRITRIGAFIRKTRIDELPQLFSVLRGEMSMVGPRPERPAFVAQLREQIRYYDLRHTVKPGLTGWAQTRYSYGASLEDARRKHQFDLYYVKNNSLMLDLQVLVDTVSVVLFREGAH